MNIDHLLARLPHQLSLPTFAEMRERTHLLRDQRGVDVRTVGEDRTGESIEMISLGDGPTSVLLIGAPHPNEPIGCIAIERLIHELAADPVLLRQTGCRWHFIKAIEPYALKQNEGWFKRPDVATYLQHFYRPSGADQAEYSFPAPRGMGGSWQPCVENAAYRQALQIAQPDLLASLHNAEGSGAFYFLSRDDALLATRLSAQAAQNGLPLNLLGEEAPDVREAPLAPGVFLLLDEPRPTPEAREHEGLSVNAWLAAQGRRPRCFLVPEVPLFVDSIECRFASAEACLRSAAQLEWPARLDALLADHLALMDVAATPLEQLYLDAILEMVPMFKKLLNALPELQAKASPGDLEAQVRAQVLLSLRPMAMARRLAAMRAARADLLDLASRARASEQACTRELAAALDTPLLRNAFQPVPLRAAVATQLQAVLATATAVVHA